MKLNAIIFLLILFLCENFLLAQDSIKSPTINFNIDNSKPEEISSVKRNALKINPILLIRGEMPLYYERALTKSISAEIAVGITNKDYIQNMIEDISKDIDEVDPTFMSKEKSKSNISYKLGIRFYKKGMVMDGFYFALEFAKRDYTSEVIMGEPTIPNNLANTSSSVTKFIEKTNHLEYKIIFGNQNFYFWEAFFVDYYIGLGIDQYSDSRVSFVKDRNSTEVYELKSTNKLMPGFYLGIKLGFVF